jgi:hypothetical protein
VVVAQESDPDLDGPAGERLAAAEPAAGVLQPAEVVVQRRHRRVGRAGEQAEDRQPPPVEAAGRGEPAGVLARHAGLVAHHGDLGGRRPVVPLGPPQGPPVPADGPPVVAAEEEALGAGQNRSQRVGHGFILRRRTNVSLWLRRRP